MLQVKAKKHLGQHFLKNEQIAKDIADTIDISPELPILEIGPGMGVLTKYLLLKGRDLCVVELDTESVDYLKIHYPELQEHIIDRDFLKLKIDEIPFKGDFAIIGNYPYNISSQIFFKVLEWKERIPLVAGMLQKEVARRLASKEGSKEYGILSVLLQTWYDVEYLFDVAPGNFLPPPKVNSGVIRLVRNFRTELPCREDLYKRLIKTAFNQRRKTLRNSLRVLFGDDKEYLDRPIFSMRPEQLSVEEFIELTLLEEERNSKGS